jgi:signal transduction histidine kinase
MVSGEESTGLGLPLTARLMALHGGRLHLSNARTGGLIARLEFPPARTIRRGEAASDYSARVDVGASRAAG